MSFFRKSFFCILVLALTFNICVMSVCADDALDYYFIRIGASSSGLATFEANGGTFSNGLDNLSVEGTVNFDNYVPSRFGYVFLGWYTSSNGGSKVSGIRKVDESAIYYAHWQKKVLTVNFYSNVNASDNQYKTQKFTYGNKNQKFSDNGFVKNGYTLVGWSLTRDGVKKYDVLSGVNDNFIDGRYPSVNLYAVWLSDSTVVRKYNSATVDNFIAALDNMSKQISRDGNWKYKNSGMKGTFIAERSDDRSFSCAKYIVWALQDIGVFDDISQGMWKCYNSCGNKDQMRYRGNGKDELEKYFTFIDMKNQTTSSLIKNGSLKRGDIVLWYHHQHVDVYAGDGKWYDAGLRKGNWGYYKDGNYHFKTLGPLSWNGYGRVWGVYRLNSEVENEAYYSSIVEFSSGISVE